MQYSTSFPLTENPISEGSIWRNGLAIGGSWCDCRSTPGLCFGTETASGGTDDSTAIITGTWGPIQTVQGTVRIITQPTVVQAEVELRLHSTISAASCTGYEVLFNVKDNSYGPQIIRWNGPFNNFTQLNGAAAPVKCVDGDIVKATIDGSGTITAFVNGVQKVQWTDTTYTTGNPGLGFYANGAPPDNSDYGFSAWQATDGLDTTPGFNMTPGMNIAWRRR